MPTRRRANGAVSRARSAPRVESMAELTLEIVAEVVEACKAGAEEAGAAFGRGLDLEVALSVDEPGSINLEALPEGFDGPGLVAVWTAGDTGALFVVPESSGLLPSWCADPDPTGQSKLATWAQELGTSLMPEEQAPDDFKALRVESLAEALARGGVAEGAAMVPLELARDEACRATAHLILPASSPGAVIGPTATAPETEAEPKPETPAEPAPPPQPEQPRGRAGARIEDLPSYTRSILRIQLPVVVTLARKQQPLGRILELGPGSIIQFEKSCEEMLDMEIGGHSIATGEAVKVEDKFGLRVNSMTLPDERFTRVRKD